MSDESTVISRRTVLRSAVGAVPAAGAAGLATADGDGVAKYNVGYSAESGLAAAREAASEVVREYSFDALTVRLPQRAADGLRRRSDVRYVEADGTTTVDGQTLPWSVDRIDADRAPGTVDGAGIDVAVLDTGVDSDHPDLEAHLGDGAWVEGLECTSCDVGWGDNYDDGVNVGHGTQVAGIVGAIDNSIDVVGVAPAVVLHSVKVCDSSGVCAHSDIAAGLEWATDQNHAVANMSFSGDYASVVDDAVDYAADRNVVMVASAGNDGPCTDCVNYPAWDFETIAVTAITDEEDLRTDSNQGDAVDLTAPGEDIPTTAPGVTPRCSRRPPRPRRTSPARRHWPGRWSRPARRRWTSCSTRRRTSG